MQNNLTLEEGAVAAVVGSAAIDLRKALSVIDDSQIRKEHFQDLSLRIIWQAIELHIREQRQVDYFSVRSLSHGAPTKLLDKVLVDAVEFMPGIHGVAGGRLAAVREKGDRLQLADALMGVMRLLQDQSVALPYAVAEAQKALLGVSQKGSNIRSMDIDVGRLRDQIHDIADGKHVAVVPTGLKRLDALIGGLQPTLTVIGSLPGVGKSGLLATIITNLARRGVSSGLVSLEDEAVWLARRALSQATDIPAFVLANYPLHPQQLARVEREITQLGDVMGKVIVDDRSGLTTDETISSARSMLVRGARVLFVDHLGEIRLERSDRHDLDVIDCLQQLRGLAKTYHVPVVVLCHLRRRDGLGVSDEPRLTDFAFSAGVERMARVAIGLSRSFDAENPEEHSKLNLYLLKQTQGIANVKLELDFHGPSSTIVEREDAEQEQRIRASYGIEARNVD